ncbi:MAG: hypothetical protein H6553_03310 [Chitinophagales bacterium]|nr:hypothetical protein [Chitinophagales bacterium]
MKKIIFISIVFALFFTACKKEDTPTDATLHGTRLKAYTVKHNSSIFKYTISYNSFNKMDKVVMEEDGLVYRTAYLIYKNDKSLDSIISKNSDGSLYSAMNIECNNFNIVQYNTQYTNTTVTYNRNGFVDKRIYIDESFFRNEYGGDSVLLYYKDNPVSPEVLKIKYKLSATIKNPFYITGFEKEAYITGVIFYYNNSMNALLPTIEIQATEYYPLKVKNYIIEGNFNGYPTSRIRDYEISETFTYEEF